MTKAEALTFIQNSTDKKFMVKPCKRNTCDLCNCQYDYGCEFTVSAKHINGASPDGFNFKTYGKQRSTKHICSWCFGRLFPEDVIYPKYVVEV